MNYTLYQLRAFICVAKHKSITKASEELNLTQPAVSIQIKRLQDQFEIPLTEVIGRQLYITDFGNKILEISKEILVNSEKIKQVSNEYKGLLTGKIKISVVSTGKYVMPYFLNNFMKKYPEVEISIDVNNRNKVLESLKNNETDISLVSILPEGVEVNSIELMENKLLLVGPNEIDESKIKKPSSLANQTLLYRENGSATRKKMENYLDENNVLSAKKMELVSNEAVKQAVNAGLGISIMPIIGLKNELRNKEIKIIKMKGLPIITKWNMVYLSKKELSPAIKAFTIFIEEEKEQVIEKYFSWVKEIKY